LSAGSEQQYKGERPPLNVVNGKDGCEVMSKFPLGIEEIA
jgi:hypothetical protein